LTLEAAFEVCDAALDDLESLVVKSLLRHTDERFWMLETIREFAAERLDESGATDELRRRHAYYFLELFEAHDNASLQSQEPFNFIALVTGEQDNARYALAWFQAAGDPVELARVVVTLVPLWVKNPSEGRPLLETVLAESDLPDGVRARALWGAAMVARLQVDVPGQKRYFEEVSLLYERLGDRPGYGSALLSLAVVACLEGDYVRGRALLGESRLISAEIGDRIGIAIAANIEAHIVLNEGRYQQAERMLREALTLAREAESRHAERTVLVNLGSAVLEQGRVDEASALFRECLSISDHLWVSDEAVEALASVAVARGDAKTAARMLGAIEAWRRKTGRRADPFELARAERTAATARKILGESAYRDLAAEGAKLDLDQAIAAALTIP
jgi:non-specific serine/threonine protein kinase